MAIVYPGGTTYPSPALYPGVTQETVLSLVTVPEAVAFLGNGAADEPELLQRLIETVTEQFAVRFGIRPPGTYTDGVPVQGGTVFLPPGTNVVAVSVDGQPVSGWSWGSASGLLRGLSGWYGVVEVTYTVGVSQRVKHAALLTIRSSWEQRAGAVPVAFGAGGDESYSTTRTFFVPKQALELLGVGPSIA